MRGPERPIGVVVRGAGNIGGGVIRELQRRGPELGVQLVGVLVDDPTKPREFQGPEYTKDSLRLLSNPRVKILVEAPGGVTAEDSKKFMVDAMLDRNISIVTPAKAPVALHGPELFEATVASGVNFLFEGAVAGGTPVIDPIRQRSRVDRVKSLRGIVNGTTNHILTEMMKAVNQGKKRGVGFKSKLRDAIAAGYAETDPTNDIEGFDAAYKLAVLIMVAFDTYVDPRNIDTRGITEVAPEDLEFASRYRRDERGHRLKLLAIAKADHENSTIQARVTPALIKEDDDLASVDGVFNAVQADWELGGPQMYRGRGAGRDATTAAVMDDISRVVRNLGGEPDKPPSLSKSYKLQDQGEIIRPGYIRMLLDDTSGSAGVAYTIMGEHDLNIGYIHQAEDYPRRVEGRIHLPDIVTFRSIAQRNVDEALEALRRSGRVAKNPPPVFFPFEDGTIAA